MATHSTISQQMNSSEFWPIKGGICHVFRHLGFQIKIMLLLSLYILQCLSFTYINLLLLLFISLGFIYVSLFHYV